MEEVRGQNCDHPCVLGIIKEEKKSKVEPMEYNQKSGESHMKMIYLFFPLFIYSFTYI